MGTSQQKSDGFCENRKNKEHVCSREIRLHLQQSQKMWRTQLIGALQKRANLHILHTQEFAQRINTISNLRVLKLLCGF